MKFSPHSAYDYLTPHIGQDVVGGAGTGTGSSGPDLNGRLQRDVSGRPKGTGKGTERSLFRAAGANRDAFVTLIVW